MKNTDWVKKLMAGGALTAALVGVVTVNEGYSSKAYYDGAKVATICYGETKDVKIGMVKTKSQCDAQLLESLSSHAQALEGVPLKTPDVVALGATDMAYNIGVYGFNSSSVKKAIIAGDYKKAGAAVLQWRYITVNGKKFDCSVKGNTRCYGLWKRRQWQSMAIGNQFSSPQEALDALRAVNG